MEFVKVSFSLTEEVSKGLANGIYKRVGGAIFDTEKGAIVSFMREFGAVDKLLTLIEKSPNVNLLTLGISTMGFLIMLKQLELISKRLQSIESEIARTQSKIDLAFYANFRAAVNLAQNAFSMSNSQNRKVSAMQAINRFTESRYHYFALADKEIELQSVLMDEYVTTLALTTIAEVRCYLELEELDTAYRVLETEENLLRPRAERHINSLLTSNPAAYLHPSLKGKIDLNRLVQVLQWQNPNLNENAVFEILREKIFTFSQETPTWIKSLPSAILNSEILEETDKTSAPTSNTFSKAVKMVADILPVKMQKNAQDIKEKVSGTIVKSSKKMTEKNAYERLPSTLLKVERMIENMQRLTSYKTEIYAMKKLQFSFEEWLKLKPSESSPLDATHIYITPKQPIEINKSVGLAQ